MMRRRKFITLLGGGAAAVPLAAWAQQGERVRRVGVLTSLTETDPEQQVRNAAFLQGLRQSGWSLGSNLEIEYRHHLGDTERTRKQAAELVALAPDVILATGTIALGPLLQTSRSVPIVFVMVVDPVGGGFVDSLARPGGNATGFTQFEYGLSGKWLEVLKEAMPDLTRAAVLREPGLTAAIAQFAAIQSIAPSLRVDAIPLNVRDAGDMERSVGAFAARPSGDGLIVTSSPLVAVHRELIIKLAARHKLPAVYYQRFFVADGGLISYGPDFVDQYRRAAGYVDRILRGEKPADLPVQAPAKYELAINLKTAKALGLELPPTLLARADEVIE
jgi:putative tryptophan/tyrosine transport system substrate-binding protein